jgi:O-succinylhomoserine sulfhydrylase
MLAKHWNEQGPTMSTTPLHPETLAIRAGKETSDYQEHSQAMFLTSSFKSASAAEAAKLFSGEIPGYTYSRFTNPTVSAFQARLAALEGGERAVATASGMAAIHGLVQAFLSAGDHIVASQSLFGATVQLLGNILPRFGIEVTFVAATDLDAWRAAVQPNTKLFYLETPSNPLHSGAKQALRGHNMVAGRQKRLH